MRLGLIHIGQETNDFNPVPTTLRDYQAFGVFEGPAMLEALGTVGQIGGHQSAVAAADGVTTVPIIRAWACAGGRVSRAAVDYFDQRIRAGLAAAGPLDGLALQLHGACAAEGLDDVEGAQVALCRALLGPDVPIVLELDHHANVTQRMIDGVDAVTAYRTQPHEPFETGAIGAALLIRIAGGAVRPVMAWRKIPLLSHQEQFLTRGGPMKTWFDAARAMEQDPRVLQAATLPMQPWLDVAEAGWSVVVTTDGDQPLAERLADELADLAWSLRDAFQLRETNTVDAAVLAAERAPKGVVVLSDTGDTVFGGAAGDSNLILEAMLRLGTTSRTLIPLISPAAVATLVAAGVGADVSLPLGGDATGFFTPLTVTGRARTISDGRIRIPGHAQPDVDMGRTVVFETGPVTLLISELRGLAGNLPEIYRAFGIEPSEYKIAVLKTASNFQYFAPITAQVIRADTRGPGQSDVFTLPWRRIPRPTYPLDAMTDWRQPSKGIRA